MSIAIPLLIIIAVSAYYLRRSHIACEELRENFDVAMAIAEEAIQYIQPVSTDQKYIDAGAKLLETVKESGG